ncbi:hypothetical protein A9179_08345 [Pseudomonas alcaligenes]|uniref:DUF5629 domain-containing protein n=1 Tax=Aquipseudomonas alcaligenes TaxID=43263 RepID=A0ABR7RZU5_AQUAC|nr:DUF5629 family protein [Pseudomonas alcaligenes]MBC9250282.1 hypothetical protein [Pseudomonas alcaligenes]
MTATPSLLAELQNADMLLIDDLHAWQFDLQPQAEGEQVLLRVECMDGRTRRVWSFSAAAVAAARAGEGSWTITDATGEHQLVCLGAVVAENDDEADEAPAED